MYVWKLLDLISHLYLREHSFSSSCLAWCCVKPGPRNRMWSFLKSAWTRRVLQNLLMLVLAGVFSTMILWGQHGTWQNWQQTCRISCCIHLFEQLGINSAIVNLMLFNGDNMAPFYHLLVWISPETYHLILMLEGDNVGMEHLGTRDLVCSTERLKILPDVCEILFGVCRIPLGSVLVVAVVVMIILSTHAEGPFCRSSCCQFGWSSGKDCIKHTETS